MANIVINKWNQLTEEVSAARSGLAPSQLLRALMGWVDQMSQLRDPVFHELYETYLGYYHRLPAIDSSLGSVYWYSFDELVDVDLLKERPMAYQRPFQKASELLRELLFFKSDRPCPCCGDDDLRVLVSQDHASLFFECDQCLCLLNEQMEKIDKPQELLYPAPLALVKAKGIRPSNY